MPGCSQSLETWKNIETRITEWDFISSCAGLCFKPGPSWTHLAMNFYRWPTLFKSCKTIGSLSRVPLHFNIFRDSNQNVKGFEMIKSLETIIDDPNEPFQGLRADNSNNSALDGGSKSWSFAVGTFVLNNGSIPGPKINGSAILDTEVVELFAIFWMTIKDYTNIFPT